MSTEAWGRPVEILLVEDNPGDANLARETFEESKVRNNLMIIDNGADALAFLRRQGKYAGATRPDVILLDLNLPGKPGLDVLAEIKGDDALKLIPVVIMTTSKDDEDVLKSYRLHANCYVTKPLTFDRFIDVVKGIEHFWFTIVTLPPREQP
jgi:CheY-like chemotaxis protein